jgi:hypothetical protein
MLDMAAVGRLRSFVYSRVSFSRNKVAPAPTVLVRNPDETWAIGYSNKVAPAPTVLLNPDETVVISGYVPPAQQPDMGCECFLSCILALGLVIIFPAVLVAVFPVALLQFFCKCTYAMFCHGTHT